MPSNVYTLAPTINCSSCQHTQSTHPINTSTLRDCSGIIRTRILYILQLHRRGKVLSIQSLRDRYVLFFTHPLITLIKTIPSSTKIILSSHTFSYPRHTLSQLSLRIILFVIHPHFRIPPTLSYPLKIVPLSIHSIITPSLHTSFPGPFIRVGLVRLLTACAKGSFFSPDGPYYFGGFPLFFALCSGNIEIFDLVIGVASSLYVDVAQEEINIALDFSDQGKKKHPFKVHTYAKQSLGPNTIFMRDTYGNNILHLCVIHGLDAMYNHCLKLARQTLIRTVVHTALFILLSTPSYTPSYTRSCTPYHVPTYTPISTFLFSNYTPSSISSFLHY